MTRPIQTLWLIPALPLLAAGITALAKRPQRKLAATLAIGSMSVSFLLSCWAFVGTLGKHSGPGVERHVYNFNWLQFGDAWLQLGWVLDPLTAVMLVMVTFVGLLIFIYSVGYMAHDENFTRFFCFMSLFAAAMLGVVIANSLLFLFICWELVGVSSYLLIGFWFQKPSAAAAAKKAFVVTRIGDIGFFLGILWLYTKTGTLLFYDNGNGCLEASTLSKAFPIASSGFVPLLGIALLIFMGAMGKSGQVPLHVWLPDAMEGPTPVSALIHAATMVAAGVFLVARVFALIKPDWNALAGPHTLVSLSPPDATLVITWVGAITALFAALIAVAQTDIKRILAYSTVSQLGYMMMGLGVGGVAVGMFHLITHAFFKALLFLGAGSVIHGCHEEQDIRQMGGLRKHMPVTFATYAIGMLALSGFPLLFSGFWSKDEILHAAWLWQPSKAPFILGIIGAFLTAFYMTRQVCYVFFGKSSADMAPASAPGQEPAPEVAPHESPRVMTLPLVILAVFAMLLGFIGTPAWPWFQNYLGAAHEEVEWSRVLILMLISALVVFAGLGAGGLVYGLLQSDTGEKNDVLESSFPIAFGVLRDKFYVDELYEATVVRANAAFCRFCHWMDSVVLETLVRIVSGFVVGLSWLNRFIDEYVVNLGFDAACQRLRDGGGFFSRLQDGQLQNYLRVLALGLTVLLLLLTWGWGK
jgi:NADH-quinone oxidoreductase subunit L